MLSTSCGFGSKYKFISCDVCGKGSYDRWNTKLHDEERNEFNVCPRCKRSLIKNGEL